MRSRALAILAVAAFLAGCLSTRPDAPTENPQAAVAEPLEPYLASCLNGLLFQFVDYPVTDQYLPPGFHPRDPQEFLQGVPVAFGRAGVIVFMLQCVSADGVPYQAASVDIFVESPQVEGVEPGVFDFYEIERYGDPDEFGGVLTPSGWPRLPGRVNFTLEAAPIPPDVDVIARVSDDAGEIMTFGGPTSAIVDVGAGVVRFWHDGPRGLAYYQYDAVLNARVGPGVCNARQGTALANLAPNQLPLANLDLVCPPAYPIVALFPRLTINATAAFLPGVHAE